jgi:hypothetical protein
MTLACRLGGAPRVHHGGDSEGHGDAQAHSKGDDLDCDWVFLGVAILGAPAPAWRRLSGDVASPARVRLRRPRPCVAGVETWIAL